MLLSLSDNSAVKEIVLLRLLCLFPSAVLLRLAQTEMMQVPMRRAESSSCPLLPAVEMHSCSTSTCLYACICLRSPDVARLCRDHNNKHRLLLS